MSAVTEDKQKILLESGTNELEIIEFQLRKELPGGGEKNLSLRY